MPSNLNDEQYGLVAAWAKRCYLAGRTAMEAILRPSGLGATQWYVLHRLAEGPAMQRDLVRLLQVERATLSPIVGALARKGLVEQIPDQIDQRQKQLRLTSAGAKFWDRLPDLTAIRATAFSGIDEHDLSIAIDVLRTATERLDDFAKKGNQP